MTMIKLHITLSEQLKLLLEIGTLIQLLETLYETNSTFMNSILNSSVLQYLGDLKRCVLNEKDGMFLMLYLANSYPTVLYFYSHVLAAYTCFLWETEEDEDDNTMKDQTQVSFQHGVLSTINS